MASQRSVTRDVERQVSHRGTIGGRNPVSDICAVVGQNTAQGKQRVEQAIATLENNGKVVVERKPDGRIDSIRHLNPRRHVDRTEMSPQAKRERTFAKGVPAYLPDSMCSPVETRYAPPAKAGSDAPTEQSSTVDTAPQQGHTYTKGAPYHETLTMCLQVLREWADETGTGKDLSVRSVLLTIDGMTDTSTGRALNHLRGLGLYTTEMTGFRTSSYVVDLETECITAEMVTELRQSQRKVRTAPSATSNDSTPQDIENVDVASSRMADIIEDLERQLAAAHKAVLALDAANAEQAEELEQLRSIGRRLVDHNAQLHARVGELEARLSAKPAVDPRVSDIIERFSQM